MNLEVNVSVYSVITTTGTREQIQAYLYSASEIVDRIESESGRYSYFIIRTRNIGFINNELQADSRSRGSHIIDRYVDEVCRLANYQLDRLGSGSHGGILAGSLVEAQALAADAAVNS